MTQHKKFNNLICPSCGEILKERFILNNCVCLICKFQFKNGIFFKKKYENEILGKKEKLKIENMQIANKLCMLYRDIRNATISIKKEWSG